MRQSRIIALGVLVIIVIVGASFAIGLLELPVAPQAQLRSFTAKWICNPPPSPPSAARSIGLVPGEYQTDINVHNPSRTQSVNVTKKFVLSMNETKFVYANRTARTWTVLGPNAAFNASCTEILTLLGLYSPGAAAKAAKGFVILYARTRNLDVWAEYSSESFDTSGNPTGISLHVQRIDPVLVNFP